MTTTFRSMAHASMALERLSECAYHHAARSRPMRLRDQVRCLSYTPQSQSGHSYVKFWHVFQVAVLIDILQKMGLNQA